MQQHITEPSDAFTDSSRALALLLRLAAAELRGEELAWTTRRVLQTEYGLSDADITARVQAAQRAVGREGE